VRARRRARTNRSLLVLGVFAALSLGGYLARDRLLAALERRFV
jgi:hypothetical protein